MRLPLLTGIMRLNSPRNLSPLSMSTRSMETAVEAGAALARSLKIGLVQMPVTSDKGENINRAESSIDEAVRGGAELVLLPEIWNGPYATTAFPDYAEKLPGVGGGVSSVIESSSPSSIMLLRKAQEHNVWLIGGSISERSDNGDIYNTCLVVSPDGKVMGKHRKMHLFDIDVQKPKKMYFKESETLTAGDAFTLVDSPWGTIGVGICYDLRFPEMATVMRQEGVRILAYPGAFNMVTGPAHWHLLARARAMDNQVFLAMCSPARVTEDEGNDGYVAFGHSLVVDPWGEVKVDLGPKEAVEVVECDLGRVDEVRLALPYWTQKRADMYEVGKPV